MSSCSGLTQARYWAPTKAAHSLLSTAGQGRENLTQGSWVEIKDRERDHSPNTIMSKTGPTK